MQSQKNAVGIDSQAAAGFDPGVAHAIVFASQGGNSEQSANMLQICHSFKICSDACAADFAALRADHPEWFTAALEDSDPDVAPLEDVMAFLESAPNTFARAFLAGKLTFRLMLSMTTSNLQISARPAPVESANEPEVDTAAVALAA